MLSDAGELKRTCASQCADFVEVRTNRKEMLVTGQNDRLGRLTCKLFKNLRERMYFCRCKSVGAVRRDKGEQMKGRFRRQEILRRTHHALTILTEHSDAEHAGSTKVLSTRLDFAAIAS
jgi:hypothetical protein